MKFSSHSLNGISPLHTISSGQALNQYQWAKMHEVNHERFKNKFGGQVFFIYSVKSGKKKNIYNPEVVEEIKKEIKRLEKEQ